MKTELRCFTHEMFKLCKKNKMVNILQKWLRGLIARSLKNSSFETSEDIAWYCHCDVFDFVEETPRVEGCSPISPLCLSGLLRLQTFLAGQWVAGQGGQAAHWLDTTSPSGQKTVVDTNHPDGRNYVNIVWTSHHWSWLRVKKTGKLYMWKKRVKNNFYVVLLKMWCLISI